MTETLTIFQLVYLVFQSPDVLAVVSGQPHHIVAEVDSDHGQQYHTACQQQQVEHYTPATRTGCGIRAVCIHGQMYIHVHVYIHAHVQIFFERLLPWDLICISFLCLSQMSEYLSCTPGHPSAADDAWFG